MKLYRKYSDQIRFYKSNEIRLEKIRKIEIMYDNMEK